jgi:FMN phosphatase YigB (HAD superfamily)
MRIGIDFDNTLICYDDAFYAAAIERSLIPAQSARSKRAIRDYLRLEEREDEWTELQGYIYGSGMHLAQPFPGAFDFLERCVQNGVDLCIISHKTRVPYLGAKIDLHEAAETWLRDQGVFSRIGLPRERVFFELTKEAKLARIASEQCTVFIDDLPELLTEPAFPPGVRRLLFDPAGDGTSPPGLESVRSWEEAALMLLGSPR